MDIHNIKQENDLSSLSTEESENFNDNEEDEHLIPNDNEQNPHQQLLIDTVALDAAIADADVIADQEVISSTNDKQ